MSLLSSPRRLAQIVVFHSRRFCQSKLQFSSAAENTHFATAQQLAELDLVKAISAIDLELIARKGMMPETRAAENAPEMPETPELLEDSKQDPAVTNPVIKRKRSHAKIYLGILVAILAWFVFSPIKAPCKWIPTSPELLEAAEKRILNYLKQPYTGRFVNIGPVVGSKDNEIWTVSLNEKSENLPVVLLHGFGAGIGFWVLNLDALAADRPVYAIDHLGFGRSSRPKFSSDPAKAERQFIDAIEEWRKRLNLDKFILVGHSFGGYLAMSYSITYPSSVAHLVLADPWGLPEKPHNPFKPIPWYIKTLAYVLKPLNPFWAIRAAGPKGPALLERVRPDLINKFADLNENGADVRFGEYVYHCNAHDPSGESAFHSLMHDFGWSKFPLIRRIPDLAKEIDITAMYGQQSWVSHIKSEDFPKLRTDSYVRVYMLDGAGHHIYSDAKDQFNSIILEACASADKKFRGG